MLFCTHILQPTAFARGTTCGASHVSASGSRAPLGNSCDLAAICEAKARKAILLAAIIMFRMVHPP
jgi:hypothetical protein